LSSSSITLMLLLLLLLGATGSRDESVGWCAAAATAGGAELPAAPPGCGCRSWRTIPATPAPTGAAAAAASTEVSCGRLARLPAGLSARLPLLSAADTRRDGLRREPV
jgi:hypothetical protein